MSFRPRFGISRSMTPLGRAGRSTTTSATASTRPSALRGASPISAMMALCWSSGSTAMVARPVIFSAIPRSPNVRPCNAGLSELTISKRVTSAKEEVIIAA